MAAIIFDKRYSETTLTDNPDFLTLVSTFDISGLHITCKDHIPQALETLFTQPGSFLLHVSIDELENVWPLVPPGAGDETMLVRRAFARKSWSVFYGWSATAVLSCAH